MSLVLTSLNAVTTPGVGNVISFDKPRLVTMHSILSVGNCVLTLEGSLDGVNYTTVGSAGSHLSEFVVPATLNTTPLTGIYLLFARANLVSNAGGGTVTAIIAASD